MPTPSRDTWSDWFDDADQVEQVTLDHLTTLLASLGVTADQVRYWQKAGVLPQPVKRWHEGATRALYPHPYTYMAVAEIQDLQERGYTLQQIATRLRTRFRAWNLGNSEFPGWQKEADQLADEFSKLTGNTVDQVRIVFVDEDGSEDTYGYTVGSYRNE